MILKKENRLILLLMIIIPSFSILANEDSIKMGFKRSVVSFQGEGVVLEKILFFRDSEKKCPLFSELLSNTVVYPKNKVIHARDVFKLIRNSLQTKKCNVAWRGKEELKLVKLKSAIAPPTSLQQKILRDVTSKFVAYVESKVDGVVHAELLPYKGSWKGVEDGSHLTLELPAEIRLKKRTAVWVKFVRNQKVIDEVPFWFKLKVVADRFVTRERILRYENISTSNIYKKKVEVDNHFLDVVDEIEFSDNYRATLTLPSGTVLRRRHLEIAPLIERNQRVRVEYRKQNVQLDLVGKSMNEGRLGETVKVLVEGGVAPITATVLSKNRVRVNYEKI
jgi:flagella basal body P-ring formation protein FlgA